MEFLLKSAADIERLEVEAVTERLQYVAKALPLIKSALGGRTALIGFAGLAVDAGQLHDGRRRRQRIHQSQGPVLLGPATLRAAAGEAHAAVAGFLHLQIEAGADAVQIFDSLGGVLSDGDFARRLGALDRSRLSAR